MHAPTTRPSRLPASGSRVAGRGDRITPPDQAEALAAHWGVDDRSGSTAVTSRRSAAATRCARCAASSARSGSRAASSDRPRIDGLAPTSDSPSVGPLLLDGAMGSLLYERGVLHTRSYDELNLAQPELIRTRARRLRRAPAPS